MAWYRAGTVSVTNNSTAVTGSGTAWVTAAAIGETFLGPDGQSYEIVALNSATSLSIAPAYKGSTASGQNYALMPTQGYLRDLAAAAAALVESYSSVKNNAGTGKFAAGTSANPSLRNAADENTGLNFKGNDQLALVTAGIERMLINAAGVPSGTAAAHLLNRANHTGTQPVSSITGLGSAATRNVGALGGDVMEIGYCGFGSPYASPNIGDIDSVDNLLSGIYTYTSATAGARPSGNNGTVLVLKYSSTVWRQIAVDGFSGVVYHRQYNGTTISAWSRFWTGLNTTVDSNGFVKSASPIVNLYADHADKNDAKEVQAVKFTRTSAGVYLLTDCPPLSEEGWYLEQPRDRNNNVYHNVEWYYDETTKTLRIETYKRVWNAATGEYENGEPADIQSGRFISLRFKECLSLYPEPEESEVSDEG